MIRYNPDPHTGGYAYVPHGAVTACFPAGDDHRAALEVLTEAGYAQDRIDVFMGKQGADMLDMEGRKHGRWVRFMRTLEDTFTDDAYLFHRTDQILKAGGTVVAVFTHGKEEERQRVVEIFKGTGGIEPVYWGRWVTQTF